MSFKKVESRVNLPELESRVLEYWEKNKTFEKSVEGRPKNNTFSFYDGPPFATGTPHYGHLLPGTVKDVIPRFKTMQGFRVERIWGWDTHGLPIENIVEQELDFKSRTQIEEYGVDRFNEKCRTKVLKYADQWKKIVAKTGRWVDMENSYLTMDFDYMESVWWVFKTLWDKELIYKGHKVMPYCPRCATGLSAFEVGMPGTYQDKHDKAVTVRFELSDEPGTYLLAWTTTPWTLPANLALAVGKDINYVKVTKDGKKYILAKERLVDYAEELGSKIEKEFKGSELAGLKYTPVFNYYLKTLKSLQGAKGKAFEVVMGDHVSIEDGTGIVHTAPAFGEDDYKVAKENGLDFFMPVNDLGQFEIDVPEYSGKSVIEFETNNQIIKDLSDQIIKIEEISHSYPHCWRCDSPLIYKAIDSYFVDMGRIKKEIARQNKQINWVPKSVGAGRFANLIETAPDWNISRNRFWGTPLPVWICEKCHQVEVFGSRDDLSKVSGEKIEDLHLHKIRDVSVPCKCGGKMKLSGEVLDCWFESGSMPYGQIHYPFENNKKFETDFPADFISESLDQTRGWFNSLLILSTALFGEKSYKNVVVTGMVLAENGQKMSKHLKNYPEVSHTLEQYGADAMRFYLMGSPAVKGEDLRFSEKGVDEVVKKVILTLWNSYGFFVTYANLDNFKPKGKHGSTNLLDKWLYSKTNRLIIQVTELLENYEIAAAVRKLSEYVDELSNWYIRRSRKRFWKSENDIDKNAAYEALFYALTNYAKLLAPFMPFVTDEMYQNLTCEKSVHLADWPKAEDVLVDEKLENEMSEVRQIVEAGLAARNEAGIKVRQPLAKISVASSVQKIPDDLKKIIAEEVNVKKVEIKKAKELSVKLDTKITPELKAEGFARDFIRYVQDGRKKAGFNVEDRIETIWESKDKEVTQAIESQKDYIAKETLSVKFLPRAQSKGGSAQKENEYVESVKLNGYEVWFGISRSKGQSRLKV